MLKFLNKILIVDDDKNARMTLEGLLRKDGYEIFYAENGREAMDCMDNHPIDLILMDVMMPEINGFDLCLYFKKHEKWQHIPIIIITALDSKDDLVRGLDAGADEFLTKPIMGVELRARVRSMLRIKNQYDELQAEARVREEMGRMLIEDMREPISHILVGADVLRRIAAGTSAMRHRIERVYSDARRMNTMIDNLLLLAKMRADSMTLTLVDYDILNILEEVITMNQVFIESKNITFGTDFSDSVINHPIDKNLIQRMLDNLLAHIIENAENGVELTVSVKKLEQESLDDPSLCLTIVDPTRQIPQEYHYRMFEELEVASLKRKGVAHADIGLVFCKRVAKAHGGTIFIRDHDAGGIEFVIEL